MYSRRDRARGGSFRGASYCGDLEDIHAGELQGLFFRFGEPGNFFENEQKLVDFMRFSRFLCIFESFSSHFGHIEPGNFAANWEISRVVGQET